MKRVILAVAILFIAVSAQAAVITLGWDAPIASEGVVSTEIYYGTVCGTYGTPVVIPQPANQGSVQITADGSYCFAAKFVDASGNKSVFSDTVTTTIDTTAPSKPTGFKRLLQQVINWLKGKYGSLRIENIEG